MDARVTPEEMGAFHEATDNRDADLPDAVLQKTAYFQWWLFARRLENLGRAILDSLRFRRDRRSSSSS